jgi:hypothetical protein
MFGGLLFVVCVVLQFHYHDPIPWYIWAAAWTAHVVQRTSVEVEKGLTAGFPVNCDGITSDAVFRDSGLGGPMIQTWKNAVAFLSDRPYAFLARSTRSLLLMSLRRDGSGAVCSAKSCPTYVPPVTSVVAQVRPRWNARAAALRSTFSLLCRMDPFRYNVAERVYKDWMNRLALGILLGVALGVVGGSRDIP